MLLGLLMWDSGYPAEGPGLALFGTLYKVMW